MTLVTEANFWKSKVRSGVTYMFSAMDAKLQTATYKREFGPPWKQFQMKSNKLY